jgi:hypothetical protein
MRGGAQSHLMLGSDDFAYIVKFQNNPQHLRVLANEFLATGLAKAVGLTVPEVSVVYVEQWLITSSSELTMESGKVLEPCKAGHQFGSRFVGGLLPGQRMDYLPEGQLCQVRNRHEFSGILAMDKWTSNSDGRQAVFHKCLRDKNYMATFIDQGYCFDAGSWTFNDAPLRGVYARNEVYRDVTGWESFEPWLSRLETMDPQTAWDLAQKIPPEWLGSQVIELEILIDRLFARRSRIRELIVDFRESSRDPFPQWTRISLPKVPVRRSQVLSWNTSLAV